MIASIRGKLLKTGLTEIIIDVNGVGYRLLIPMSTYDKLPREGGETALLTYMQVREDAITLFGFATEQEKELFEILISVSGIGARIALSVLSSMPVSVFCSAVASGDINSIKRINGIGKRTAERLLVELKDKISRLALESAAAKMDISDKKQNAVEDALTALEQLGFKREKAQKTVLECAESLPENECSSENLIRKTLKSLNS